MYNSRRTACLPEIPVSKGCSDEGGVTELPLGPCSMKVGCSVSASAENSEITNL